MRRLLDLPLLVILLGIGSGAMFLPASFGLVSGDYHSARAFFYAGVMFAVITAMLGLAVWGWRPGNVARSHLLQLVCGFALLPLMLAWPMTVAMPGLTYLNAWFEMVSSLTTTGATIFNDPGSVPPSVHLWRALIGWLGGFFILLAALAILAPMNLGGFEVLTGGVAGRGVAGVQQITRIADPSTRMQRYAGQLLPIYAGLTLLLWVLLSLAGDPALVGFCHAMSILSTSGISPIGGLQNAASGRVGEAMVLLFLVFALSRRAFPGQSERLGMGQSIVQDPEFRLALGLIAAVSLSIFSLNWLHAVQKADLEVNRQALASLWGAVFTTTSFLTTTGFLSADWIATSEWSGFTTSGLILVGLALVGGGVATTAGGVKLLRVYALYQHSGRQLDKLVHPSSVGGLGTQARRLRRQGAYVAWIFVMLFILSVTIVIAALALTGLGFEDALVMAISALTTTGQLAEYGGPRPLAYTVLGGPAKVILAAAMVLGRLEMLALIALLVPDSWRG